MKPARTATGMEMLPTAIRMATILARALQPGRVDGMAEAERLKHAPQAVIQVIAKHDHRDDVEQRNRPDLKASDHIVVDIVLVERAAGMDGAKGEMQQVEDHKGQR